MTASRPIAVAAGFLAILFAGCAAPAPEAPVLFPALGIGDLWSVDGEVYKLSGGIVAVDRFRDAQDVVAFHPADITDPLAIAERGFLYHGATRDVVWRWAPDQQWPVDARATEPFFLLPQLSGLEAVAGASHATTFRELPATIEIVSVTEVADAGAARELLLAAAEDVANEADGAAADASTSADTEPAQADASSDASAGTATGSATVEIGTDETPLATPEDAASDVRTWVVTGAIVPVAAVAADRGAQSVDASDAAVDGAATVPDAWSFRIAFDDAHDWVAGAYGHGQALDHPFALERIAHVVIPLPDRAPALADRVARGVSVGALTDAVKDHGACSPLTTVDEILAHPYFADAYADYASAHADHVLAVYDYGREGTPFGRYNDRPDRNIVQVAFVASDGSVFAAAASQYTGKAQEPESAIEPIGYQLGQVQGVQVPENAVPVRDQLCLFADWTQAQDLPTSFTWTLRPGDYEDPTAPWTSEAAGVIRPLQDWAGSDGDRFAFARLDGATGGLIQMVAATTVEDASQSVAPVREAASLFGVRSYEGWLPGHAVHDALVEPTASRPLL